MRNKLAPIRTHEEGVMRALTLQKGACCLVVVECALAAVASIRARDLARKIRWAEEARGARVRRTFPRSVVAWLQEAAGASLHVGSVDAAICSIRLLITLKLKLSGKKMRGSGKIIVVS